MGIDVEDIKLCVCRIVHLSLRVSHRFVQQHPYVSGTLLFLFVLYIFLPSVLSFLFYSLPFLGLAGVLLAFWTSKRSKIRCEKVEDKKLEVTKQSTPTINRNRSAYLRNATSRRQRFKEKSDAWRPEAPTSASVVSTVQLVESDDSKSLIEVKETQSLESGNNNASAHSTSVEKDIEVSSKNEPILGSELLVKPDPVACDGSSSQANKSDSGGDEAKNESSEDPEDEDEEEAQEDRNKAVEWTEDDQKNLMDLGLSEIERNRRLESLIARRRARKLYKRKNEETALTADMFPPGHIPKIVTTRNDPHDLGDGCKDIEGIPLPGSAPSVLLPMRNPFDLPYDPHEEKPNLMADSFQQEFTAAHQKELAFCRHESFCFGPAFPEETGALGYHPRYRRPSISIADKGEHDWLIEQLLFKGDQGPRAEKNPIAVETRGIQTEDSPQARDVSTMELESDQEKEIPPDSESEFEMEPELTQDVNSQSSHSSSSDNPEVVICDDVRVVSKSFGSTLSSALNKSLSCRVPKSRLIKEPLGDFSPTAFDKNKMEERFPYADKVACHTPTYSIASDLQVEVSEIGSPPTVDGNNTDGESLNPDWEIEKEASFGGEQDDTSPLLESRSNEIVSDLQEKEEEVEAMSVTEASSPKTIQSPMAEELVNQPSQVVPQMPEELSIPTDDDEEAINHVIDQKDPEALENMENTVKTSDDVDGGLEMLMKQEDDGKKTSSLEETDLKSSKYSNDGPEDSSGCRSHLDHAHSDEGSKNVDQITGNGDLGRAHEHSEEGSKNKNQIIGNRDLGRAREHSEEESKNMDQITGNGDLAELRKIEEQLELIQDNKNQPNVVETEFQSSKDALKLPGEDDSATYGGVPLDTNDIICSDASEDQGNAIQSEFQWSNGDLVEPRKLEEPLELKQDNKNQPNVVKIEFQSSKDASKSIVEDDLVTDGEVSLDSNDIMCFDASQNQVNVVQREFQRSNGDLVDPRKIEEPLGLKQDDKNQPNVVEIEFQSSKDASKLTVEDDLVIDGGVSLDSNDIICSDASQNQVNVVQSEFQGSNGDLVEPRKIEEQLELKQDSKNQSNVVEIEFQSSKDASKSIVEGDLVTDGGASLDSNDIIRSDVSHNQVNALQNEFQRSNGDLVEPRKIEEPSKLKQDNKNQPNVVEIEFQSSEDALKSTVEDDLVTDGGVPLDSNDIMCFDASHNQVNTLQSEFQRSNGDLVEPRKIEEPLELKQDNKNQPNVVEIEFQSSKDASKSTIEDDLVTDGGVSLDSNDIIRFDASQNQVNAVQSEFQRSNGDLVEPRKIEEPWELKQDNKNQPNVVEIEFQSSKDASKLTVADDLVTNGGVSLDSNDIICSDASHNQVNTLQSEFQRSNGDLVEPRKIKEPLELKQDNKNQPNVVEIEFQSSKDASKSIIEDDLVTDGGVSLDSNDIIRFDASQNQENVAQSEFQRSKGDIVEPRKIEEPLELKQDNKNQPNVVEIEFQSSKDASKLTVEDDLVTDGGVSLDFNDIMCSDASQNQVNVVQSEFQKSNDAMKSNVEQDPVIERELLDTKAGLSSESSIEEQVHMDKVSLSQGSIISPDNNPKTMEKDDNKPADSIEVESELIKGLSEQNGDKSNMNPKDDREKTDQNLSSPNLPLNDDLKSSKIIVQEEVAVNPLTETTAKEVQVETELTPTNKNMEAVGDNKIEFESESESESHRFNKQESDDVVVKERDLEFDKDMESYSKDLNGMGLQKPIDLSADKESQ